MVTSLGLTHDIVRSMMRDSVLSDRSLRVLVQCGLFPLRVIATVYWLSLGWFIHRPDREERETLRIARAAAAAGPQEAKRQAVVSK
ncbi:hypothetical protein C3492_27565 [Streptomyces sp. Ru62]|uniref:hypothetical protein n=1 Tax=Streptomyces sp. Ru62 TaxID=2080745 RepID=UPI000CDE468B|nr:hypothetical protein [Streptomyces sp. Ru62]POX60490.1 hypothetical protein C3492_27565 [Streptomyces sp. Ru62]